MESKPKTTTESGAQKSIRLIVVENDHTSTEVVKVDNILDNESRPVHSRVILPPEFFFDMLIAFSIPFYIHRHLRLVLCINYIVVFCNFFSVTWQLLRTTTGLPVTDNFTTAEKLNR